MSAVIDERQQFLDEAGHPVVNGYLYFGAAGADPKTNPVSIYADRSFTTVIANPQRTDARGRAANKVWIDGRYSFKLEDSNNVQMYQELDNGVYSDTNSPIILSDVQGFNDIVAVATPSITSYVDKQVYIFTAVLDNTGEATLNINNLGPVSIKERDPDMPLIKGSFVKNDIIIVSYNKQKNAFQWINPAGRRVVDFYTGAAVPVASTCDIWGGNDGNTIPVSGTGTIEKFSDAPNIGARRTLIFDDVLTLKNKTTGSGNISISGESDYVTKAGDVITVYAEAINLFRIEVKRNGTIPLKQSSVVGADLITAEAIDKVVRYEDNHLYTFRAAADNTGAVTLDIDGLGPKAVQKSGSDALEAQDIKANMAVVVLFSASDDVFKITNTSGKSGYFVSNFVPFSSNTSILFTHNLDIKDSMAIAQISTRARVANNGYEIGDILIAGDSSFAVDDGWSVKMMANTVEIKTSHYLTLTPNSGGNVTVNAASWDIRVIVKKI